MKDAVLIFAVFLFASTLAVWAAGTRQHKEVPELPLPVHLPNIAEMVVSESLAAGLVPQLALGVAWSESRLTNAFSDTGDAGPMQVHIATAIRAGFNPVALLEPRNSIAVGVAWLAGYRQMCGSEHAAVLAYGRGRCSR